MIFDPAFFEALRDEGERDGFICQGIWWSGLLRYFGHSVFT